MVKNKNDIPVEIMELYAKLLDFFPDIELKGATMPYTSLNGHMFSFLSKTGDMALRLPQEQRNEFLKKYNTSLFESHGAVMKEYVHVPVSLFKKTAELKKYFKISYEYIKSLKPKQAKKGS